MTSRNAPTCPKCDTPMSPFSLTAWKCGTCGRTSSPPAVGAKFREVRRKAVRVFEDKAIHGAEDKGIDAQDLVDGGSLGPE